MKIFNNRCYFKDAILPIILTMLLVAFPLVLGAIYSSPQMAEPWLYLVVVAFLVFYFSYLILDYKRTSFYFELEDKGLRATRNGKSLKFLEYEWICIIMVGKNDVSVYSQLAPDYPYLLEILSMTKTLWKLITSKDFRKRYREHVVTIRNRKKDYDSYLKPFLEEILRRSPKCEIIIDDDCKKWVTLENPNKRPPQTGL